MCGSGRERGTATKTSIKNDYHDYFSLRALENTAINTHISRRLFHSHFFAFLSSSSSSFLSSPFFSVLAIWIDEDARRRNILSVIKIWLRCDATNVIYFYSTPFACWVFALCAFIGSRRYCESKRIKWILFWYIFTSRKTIYAAILVSHSTESAHKSRKVMKGDLELIKFH